jgi:hypothetical protein
MKRDGLVWASANETGIASAIRRGGGQHAALPGRLFRHCVAGYLSITKQELWKAKIKSAKRAFQHPAPHTCSIAAWGNLVQFQ